MSISPTTYEQLFLTKEFVMFWQKNIGAKAILKMLVKLTTNMKASYYFYFLLRVTKHRILEENFSRAKVIPDPESNSSSGIQEVILLIEIL